MDCKTKDADGNVGLQRKVSVNQKVSDRGVFDFTFVHHCSAACAVSLQASIILDSTLLLFVNLQAHFYNILRQ